jgi:LmbE family N-acetylglucosaminyl deacetylase
MRILCVHAHFDDYEFAVAGTFERWRQKAGPDFRARFLVCTDGAGGHQFRPRAETARLRLKEQMDSAQIGGFELEVLRLPDGEVPREASLQTEPGLLAALWRAIREFEPDYLFCPPVPSEPLSGVHVDHLGVAEAVRKVAYLINVPHAFTPEYPADETRSRFCKTPVIINAFDGYQYGENSYDLAVDIDPVFAKLSQMYYCHRSQLQEWLPWVARHAIKAPESLDDWTRQLRERFLRRNQALGIQSNHPVEVFTVTAWGTIPTLEQLQTDFPELLAEACHFNLLEERLRRWHALG